MFSILIVLITAASIGLLWSICWTIYGDEERGARGVIISLVALIGILIWTIVRANIRGEL